MIRHRTTRHADGVRRFRLRRFLYRPAVAATCTCEYYWGPDRSGTEQGAGGVEGLLAVSIDGTFYFPIYGDNANIVGYISETGVLAAQYVYDPYGNIIETYGSSPNLFSFGFSTKYHDRELGLIAYQLRFYNPGLGRWINRDPICEAGGVNLNVFSCNSPNPKFQQVMMLRIAVSALFYAGFRVGMTEHPAPLTGHSADSSKRLLPQAA